MVVKQIRNAVQRELTYIHDQDQCTDWFSAIYMEIFKLNCIYNKIAWSVWVLTNEGIVFYLVWWILQFKNTSDWWKFA